MPSALNSYDNVPYPSLAFLQTHPDRLAVMGTLFGMHPPAVGHCRVLEIACGDGSNLIPMAYGLPGSEFVGVDLARIPVQSARERIRKLNLKNIRIEQMDLMEITPDFGAFDYIIAHGVYAWVPEAVQEKILEICSANLSANGIAFVSYNTNPAGQVRRILREMVEFHEAHTATAPNKVKAAKNFLELIGAATDPRSPWKVLFQEELKQTFGRDERVVYHDDLADHFSPVSFGDFVARAGRRGLQFLCEAQLKEILEPDLDAEALAVLNELASGDPIAHQQYLDFVRYRRFRQTLLCHAGVALKRAGVLERVRRLRLASPMRVSNQKADGLVEFTNIRGAGTLGTKNPLVITTLRRLEEVWPRAEKFETLLDSVLPAVPQMHRNEASTKLAETALRLGASTLVDLRTYDLPLPTGVSEKPAASLLARVMARDGGMVTTLLHTHLNLEDEQGREFLELLDGSRDRQALADALAAGAPGSSRGMLLQQVDHNLVNFYKMGLLVA